MCVGYYGCMFVLNLCSSLFVFEKGCFGELVYRFARCFRLACFILVLGCDVLFVHLKDVAVLVAFMSGVLVAHLL